MLFYNYCQQIPRKDPNQPTLSDFLPFVLSKQKARLFPKTAARCSFFTETNRRKRCLCWGLFSAADKSTCGALVSVWGGRTVNVGIRINWSVCVHGDEGACDPLLVDICFLKFDPYQTPVWTDHGLRATHVRGRIIRRHVEHAVVNTEAHSSVCCICFQTQTGSDTTLQVSLVRKCHPKYLWGLQRCRPPCWRSERFPSSC